jgi:hydroxyacylglutathione hydrolase
MCWRPTITPITSPGTGALARATGATIHIHELAGPEYPHDPITDGWKLRIGDVEIEALPTPGHRPEHTSFLLRDVTRGSEVSAVLTGDSLFIGSWRRRNCSPRWDYGFADTWQAE